MSTRTETERLTGAIDRYRALLADCFDERAQKALRDLIAESETRIAALKHPLRREPARAMRRRR
ncbi:MAG TPA: hypothetical protein VFO61_06115 [Alphaproteobacteria bacterium]|nr:hypothetical protein [Alphaproteobacteria bacterium]